jgi:hypothetical protein
MPRAQTEVDAGRPRDCVIPTDDSGNGLVAPGWNSDGWHGPLRHFTLDRDPRARNQALPDGWRDVDYVLLGPPMTVFRGTEACEAWDHPGCR